MARAFTSTARLTFTAFDPPATGSLSVWFRPTWAQTDGVYHMIVYWKKSDAAPYNQFYLLKYTDSNLYCGWMTANYSYRVQVASAGYTINQNAWNNMVLTWDDTANLIKLYLHGSQIGSTQTTLATYTGNVATAFGNNDTGSLPLAGRLAEVGLWNVVLGTADLANLYAGYSPLLVQPRALTGYWPLILEDRDLGPYRRDGSPTGSPTWEAHPTIRYPQQPRALQQVGALA